MDVRRLDSDWILQRKEGIFMFRNVQIEFEIQ